MAKKATPEAKTATNEKAKAVEAAIAQIEKNYGKGSIMTLGSQPIQDIPVIPSGCIQLDMALGVGGFPRGRIIEIYGPESSGKTTLTLHAIAEAQKCGGVAAFIDAEHAFDATYARKLGVKIEELLVSQPDTGEQALDIVETLVRSGAVDIIVVDSVAALVPKLKSMAKWEIVTWAYKQGLCLKHSENSLASYQNPTLVFYLLISFE